MDPERIDNILQRASDLLDAGKPADTLRCLRAIQDQLVDRDERIECGALRGWALSEMGRFDDALEVLEVLVEEYPDSARVRGTLGVVLSNGGDLEQACDELEAAVELDAEDEIALANLALVCEKLRDYERALELYERAIELGGDIDWLLARLAAVQTDLDRLDLARSSLRRYLSLVPDDAEQWIALAILYSDDCDDEQAYDCYRRAEQIEPHSPALRLNWGVTAVRCGDLAQAERQLEQLRLLERGSAREVLLQAFLLEERGQTERAAENYERALALTGGEAEPAAPLAGDQGIAAAGSDQEESDQDADRHYALEMAMDFYARQRRRDRCEELLVEAYRANACTVELCEAFREVSGRRLARATWFSLILEARYRPGLVEVRDRRFDRSDVSEANEDRRSANHGHAGQRRSTRFQRNFQVIATDRDEALGIAADLAHRMNESQLRVREFVAEESIENAHVGVYEIERESFVFDGGRG